MGLFGNNTERQNKKSKNVFRTKKAFLVDWLPDEEATRSFSVFGGRAEQRSAVLNHAIARLYGKCGIIAIHNDNALERSIAHFGEYYPGVINSRPDTKVGFVSGTRCIYNPFCGMDVPSVVKCIYPNGNGDFALRAEGLRQYINVLRYNNLPLTLHNLYRLCGMNLDKISDEMLKNVPRNVAEDILSILMQNNLHLQVKADVRMFASSLEGKIWSSENALTDISDVRAVEQNAVLSIKLSSNNMDVLNYLATECNYLIEKGAHFLLIVDSIMLENSLMQDVIRNTSDQFATVLAGSNHMDMLKGSRFGNVELPASIARKVILFSLTNPAVANFYSEMIGKYEKIDESHSDKTENLHGFNLFKKDESSTSSHLTEDARIRAEELTRLREGAVLLKKYESAGRRGSDVELTEYFELPEFI